MPVCVTVMRSSWLGEEKGPMEVSTFADAQKAFFESFGGRLRYECLNETIFSLLSDARYELSR